MQHHIYFVIFASVTPHGDKACKYKVDRFVTASRSVVIK
jgi:hypothetical protein